MNANQENVEHMMDQHMPKRDPDDEINLLELWRALSRQKIMIILFMVLTTTVAVYIAYHIQPVYRVAVVMESNGSSSGKTGAKQLLAQYSSFASALDVSLGQESSIKSTAIAILKSRQFIAEFIRKNDMIGKIFYNLWDANTKTWKVNDPKAIPTMWLAVSNFLGMISVTENKNDNMVVLTVEWYDRDEAVFFANDLVEQINLTMKQSAVSESEKGIVYLKKELETTDILELRQVIFNLIEYQIKQIMMANIQSNYAFKVIDPAVVPPKDEFVKPKRPVILVMGIFSGLIGGIFMALILHFRRRRASV